MADQVGYTDLMIDLETLGVQPRSVITQIGLVAFNAEEQYGTIGKTIFLNPTDCLRQGMTVDWSTIAWWLKQDEAARLIMATREGKDLRLGLEDLTSFWGYYCAPQTRVWGNGSNFDVVMVEEAYRRIDKPAPWGFRNIRDMRTLVALCPAVEQAKPRIAHDALADAQAQAITVRACFASLRVQKPN